MKSHSSLQMFLLGASKNIGANPLADAVDVVIEVIRIIMKREHIVAHPHSLRFPPCTGASKRAGCHDALIAAVHAVRGCFDQLELDARSAVTSLSSYIMVRKGTSGACSHTPDLDIAFAQAAARPDARPRAPPICSKRAIDEHDRHVSDEVQNAQSTVQGII
jgi:hypothetical protein